MPALWALRKYRFEIDMDTDGLIREPVFPCQTA